MVTYSALASFVRQQALYLSVAAIGSAIFWAVGQPVNPATILLYSLLFGNLATPPMNRVRRATSKRSFPYNWLIFLAALSLLTPVAYLVVTPVVGWIAPPSPQSVSHLIRTGWKFPCLLLMVYGILSFLYVQTKERLEFRNDELERSLKHSAAQLERQEEDLERAREIQQSLLPKDTPQIAGFDLATAWQPAKMVGGDYFDVLKLDDTRLAVCIADVSGKGVSAALLMANVQATVRAFARGSQSPSDLCTRVNSVLCGNIALGKFVTFLHGVLDSRHHTFEYCNAGHPRPILISGNAIRHLPEGGAVLGVLPDWKYEDSMITLTAGDRLLLFTDGITEASSPDGEEFGEDRLAAIARDNCDGSAQAANNTVLAGVTAFCAGRFEDDATLLVIAAGGSR
jgi:sigma-B regulation protein RsbU (phosphoserine phosphatase)